MPNETEILASIARKMIATVSYIDDDFDSTIVVDGWIEDLTPFEMNLIHDLCKKRDGRGNRPV